MKQLRDVIKNADKPSWVRSVPENFGAAAVGTPKADEWRTLFTVYLPLALIIAVSRHEGAKNMAALEHTMALVCALLVSCKRTVTITRANAYRAYIRDYVRGLTELYPNIRHQSIHHMAFHVYDFLLLFGPVYSWWCFPFERLIGKLQRMNQNHRFGLFLAHNQNLF